MFKKTILTQRPQVVYDIVNPRLDAIAISEAYDRQAKPLNAIDKMHYIYASFTILNTYYANFLSDNCELKLGGGYHRFTEKFLRLPQADLPKKIQQDADIIRKLCIIYTELYFRPLWAEPYKTTEPDIKAMNELVNKKIISYIPGDKGPEQYFAIQHPLYSIKDIEQLITQYKLDTYTADLLINAFEAICIHDDVSPIH
jgi:hypothetical protein